MGSSDKSWGYDISNGYMYNTNAMSGFGTACASGDRYFIINILIKLNIN